jgi:hypothetical protein
MVKKPVIHINPEQLAEQYALKAAKNYVAYKPWEPWEDAFIRKWAGKIPSREMGIALKRSTSQVDGRKLTIGVSSSLVARRGPLPKAELERRKHQ